MNEEEIRQMIAGMLAKGWNVELCDTPVPLYDNPVRAGIPTGVGSIMASDILLPKDMIKAGLDFMLPVHGDSMVYAGISDGDTLKVRLEKNALRTCLKVKLLLQNNPRNMSLCPGDYCVLFVFSLYLQ